MSIISNGIDAFVARMQALYPAAQGWQQLPNPYKPEENPDIFLKQGWGLAFGSAENSNRQVNCKYSVARSVTVILCRITDALENDASLKVAADKALFEDQAILINDLEQDIAVNGTTMYTRWETDGGIEYIKGDTDRFLMLRTEFRLEYLEAFT